ncbi:MAG: UDP-3-O-(3-hydroxymyristoyl)glucosamine N-acyltransferase [Thermodesulfovibrionia bacterium]|nr:UDP-3-O-(3-hydroxymyristoyl)glucosamine N-acyltransferase [Thermodesulfovibrionia bacterium]
MKLKEVADLIGAEISGDPGVEITGASGIRDAAAGDITFLSAKKYANEIRNTMASAVILKKEFKDLVANSLIVDNPQYSFAMLQRILYIKPQKATGISERAVIGKNVNFGDEVNIHPLAFIGDDVSLGSRVTIYPGAHIGEGVTIGDDSVIYPNVSIYGEATVGKRVIIHAGAVIGSDGFGFVKDKGTHHKVPQVGGVMIEDDVEIGANVTIDRAAMKKSRTTIGAGTKIDNLVHIAHNVRIGKNCLLIAQAAIAGSAEIGNDVIIAGQAGVADHIKISNGAVIVSQSGVTRDIPEAQVFSGSPAIPHKTWLRVQNIITKLPEYIKRLQMLERKVNKEDPSNDG